VVRLTVRRRWPFQPRIPGTIEVWTHNTSIDIASKSLEKRGDCGETLTAVVRSIFRNVLAVVRSAVFANCLLRACFGTGPHLLTLVILPRV
jgi:hypothetical protein